MNKKTTLMIGLEATWWIFTAVVLFAALYPILSKVESFPFLNANILFIITFVTLTRYIFLLKHTFLAKLTRVKVALFFLSLIFIFHLTSLLHEFRVYADEIGLQEILKHLSYLEQGKMIRYIRNEFFFFAVAAIVSAVVFPIRMIVSVWRLKNRGTI